MPKKKTALTIEERLQQALVPAEEQPYEVPENWVWVRLGAVCYASKEKSNDFSNDIKYIGLEHLEKDKGIVGFSLADKVKSTKNAFKEGQILYGRLRPYLNKHDITSFDGVCSTDILVFEATNLVANVLVDKFFNLPFFIEYVVSNSKGINLPRVSEETVLNTTFPLPPLSEQQRIIERIEVLFAKLDEAKERLQEVADSFAVRKAAILHKAFTGELTKQWRWENGVNDASWEESNFGKFTVSQYGYTEKAHWEKIGPKFLRITDIQDNKVDWDEVPWCPIDEDGMKQYAVEIGDIMIARTGATTGKSYLICDDVEAVFASFLIRLKVVNKNLDYNYLYGYMQSEDYWRQITDFSSGIAQPGVNASKLKQIKFKCPTLPEQHEIVRLIDDLLARERSAQQAVEQALASIELMKKSILARAFRGELGTNKASEASALELLKQVLAENWS